MSGHETKAGRTVSRCAVPGCTELLPEEFLMCEACWRMVLSRGSVESLRAAIERALPLLKEMRDAWIECGSDLCALDGGRMEPIPGTLDPAHAAAVAECDQVIAACEAALEKASAGRPS